MFKETGKSRGYGFIRFKDEETAQSVVKAEHHLQGRRIEIKMKQVLVYFSNNVSLSLTYTTALHDVIPLVKI